MTVNGGGKPGQSPVRRNSWLSSISSKFSPGAHNANASPASTPPATPNPEDPPVPSGPHSPKNAILPHGAKATGDSPYTPAPPKSTQPSFLQSALRRLSSSSGGQLSGGVKAMHHGICERRVLNVDRHRERCCISELDQSKLRRVAFCVDVEIASSPHYSEEVSDIPEEKKEQRKRITEKGEGAALKNPNAVKNEKDDGGTVGVVGEELPRAVEKMAPTIRAEAKEDTLDTTDTPTDEKDSTRKKEKKKRSEEERKARKEKKRRLAEANGTIPVELIRENVNGSESSLGTPSSPGTPKTQASPTTDPARIYRRCCQLRETPILKKITEQLATASIAPGIVGKLDLTGYWLQLPDLVTLGDYLAVVPVKELIMENCGLTDEGVRVILSGLLAAKTLEYPGRRRFKDGKDGEVPQGGVVERLVFKNNTKIGRDGWRYICLFINMCRSLKSLDLSRVPFPQATAQTASHHHTGSGHLSRTTSASSANSELACLLSKAIGERLAGKEFELLNIAECGITTDQLSDLVDGIIKSGLRRLGIAGNNITSEGMKHVARYIRAGHCEGLDLGGNDLTDQMSAITSALDENSSLFALSLADCNLTPDSLWTLFPALVKLKNFRFIDLSQNHDLFDSNPSALSLLRRYVINFSYFGREAKVAF